ncbi:MAG: hypothetical protein JWP77_2762 [Polaromonas sp.]|nr:hypothetical protein [Polaromonas sp.]
MADSAQNLVACWRKATQTDALTIILTQVFRQSANAMNGCRHLPTGCLPPIVGKPLQLQTNAAGTIVNQPKNTLRNKTSWHFRLLLAALAGFSQLTPNSCPSLTGYEP